MHTAHGINCDVKDRTRCVMRDAQGNVVLIDLGSALCGRRGTRGTIDAGSTTWRLHCCNDDRHLS